VIAADNRQNTVKSLKARVFPFVWIVRKGASRRRRGRSRPRCWSYHGGAGDVGMVCGRGSGGFLSAGGERSWRWWIFPVGWQG